MWNRLFFTVVLISLFFANGVWACSFGTNSCSPNSCDSSNYSDPDCTYFKIDKVADPIFFSKNNLDETFTFDLFGETAMVSGDDLSWAKLTIKFKDDGDFLLEEAIVLFDDTKVWDGEIDTTELTFNVIHSLSDYVLTVMIKNTMVDTRCYDYYGDFWLNNLFLEGCYIHPEPSVVPQAVVPEPGTLVLVGAGLISLLAYRRRN